MNKPIQTRESDAIKLADQAERVFADPVKTLAAMASPHWRLLALEARVDCFNQPTQARTVEILKARRHMRGGDDPIVRDAGSYLERRDRDGHTASVRADGSQWLAELATDANLDRRVCDAALDISEDYRELAMRIECFEECLRQLYDLAHAEDDAVRRNKLFDAMNPIRRFVPRQHRVGVVRGGS